MGSRQHAQVTTVFLRNFSGISQDVYFYRGISAVHVIPRHTNRMRIFLFNFIDLDSFLTL